MELQNQLDLKSYYTRKTDMQCRYGVSYLADLSKINNNSAEREKFDTKTFSVNIVKENTCINNKARQWNILLFREALKIKGNVRHLIVVSKRPRN